jgi:hypothetical protein
MSAPSKRDLKRSCCAASSARARVPKRPMISPDPSAQIQGEALGLADGAAALGDIVGDGVTDVAGDGVGVGVGLGEVVAVEELPALGNQLALSAIATTTNTKTPAPNRSCCPAAAIAALEPPNRTNRRG